LVLPSMPKSPPMAITVGKSGVTISAQVVLSPRTTYLLSDSTPEFLTYNLPSQIVRSG